jgi:hypothetical protein
LILPFHFFQEKEKRKREIVTATDLSKNHLPSLGLAFTFFWIFIPYFDELQHHMGAVRMLELFWYLGAT